MLSKSPESFTVALTAAEIGEIAFVMLTAPDASSIDQVRARFTLSIKLAGIAGVDIADILADPGQPKAEEWPIIIKEDTTS